jgi:hypothetical protein
VCQESAWGIRLSSQKGLFNVLFVYNYGTPFGPCLLSEYNTPFKEEEDADSGYFSV